jgi:hypothetical protein
MSRPTRRRPVRHRSRRHHLRVQQAEGWQRRRNTQAIARAEPLWPPSASGNAGGIAWTAAAAGGLNVEGGQLSTNSPETLNFTFSPGVQGVSGNIYSTDISFNIVASIVQVTLTDGSSYIGYSDSAASFVGFYSTGASIASMSITSSSLAGGSLYPTVDNLYFASVPAPGALALVGLAGLTARRRVRR